MIARNALPWQLILADLALILFLVALAGLAGMDTPMKSRAAAMKEPAIAEAQALYRPLDNGPDFDQWLDMQDIDPRATLTVFASYTPSTRGTIWDTADSLSEIAERRGIPVRIIMKPGADDDIYTSLAFDSPN